MYRRARCTLFAAALALTPQVLLAQAMWQPTPPPLVTAENESWYRAGSPIEWNGDVYYPTGTPQAFDGSSMAPAGAYRGIPLYTNPGAQPGSALFVPIAGERMQRYERMPDRVAADRTEPQPAAVGTSGRTVVSGPVATAVPPKGINNAWIEYDGRRWVADGKAVPRSADFHQIGEFRGFPIYTRANDRSTIYVPSTADLVVPYKRK